MTNCRIGKVKFKSGGELYVLPDPPKREVRTYTEPCGTLKVTIEDTSGRELSFTNCSFALDAAKIDLWKDMGRYEDD